MMSNVFNITGPSSLMYSPHKGQILGRFAVPFIVSRNKLLNKQAIHPWFEIPWLMWCHLNGASVNQTCYSRVISIKTVNDWLPNILTSLYMWGGGGDYWSNKITMCCDNNLMTIKLSMRCFSLPVGLCPCMLDPVVWRSRAPFGMNK